MKPALALILAVTASGLVCHPLTADESSVQSVQQRLFLFTAKPSPEAWKFMKENPGDRRVATEKAMKRAGCEMIGYY